LIFLPVIRPEYRADPRFGALLELLCRSRRAVPARLFPPAPETARMKPKEPPPPPDVLRRLIRAPAIGLRIVITSRFMTDHYRMSVKSVFLPFIVWTPKTRRNGTCTPRRKPFLIRRLGGAGRFTGKGEYDVHLTNPSSR
jgi:hypothetical protein